MNIMKKVVNSFFVSFIALILATPIAGVTSTFVLNESDLSSNEILDYSRSSYGVDIDFAGENTGYESITRNQLITFSFVVSNIGTMDDTYDLDNTWEDDGAGWSGNSEYESISVDSQGNIYVAEVSYSDYGQFLNPKRELRSLQKLSKIN